MKEVIFEIIENSRLSDGIYLMRLAGDTSAVTAPGQFVNLKLAGRYLRRPISVHDWEDGELKLIYKVLGHGTEQMTTMEKGEKLNILVGLGNGFDGAKSGDKPLLVGGGVGIPPLYGLARRLRAEGKEVTAVLGFNKEADIFAVERFESIGVKTIVATADGSRGVRGFVTDGMAQVDEYSYLYKSFDESFKCAERHCLLKKPHYSHRRKNEKSYRQDKPEHHRDSADNLHQLVTEVLFKPFVKFGFGFFHIKP